MRFGAAVLLMLLSAAANADYRLELQGIGREDYYCSIRVSLHNESEENLTEINGYFYSFVGDENVGRSRGASFLNVPVGGSVEAAFLTPNAPCDEVTLYRFVVASCRFDLSFADRELCAKRIVPITPIGSAVAR